MLRALNTECTWRGSFANAELNALHAEGFAHAVVDVDWRGQLERYSLGWVTTRAADRLVGFVNVAWDGGVHAFILDTVVASDVRRRGVATRMIEIAVEQAHAAGCEWLHADYDEGLVAFYEHACGFKPTPAGLIALQTFDGSFITDSV
jgi:GNAT superfamily N-acetyltransferase